MLNHAHQSTLEPTYLVDDTLVEWTRRMLDKNTLTVYLDKSLEDMKPVVKKMVKETDKMLSIKFKFRKKAEKADIRFYQKEQVYIDPNVIGIAEYYNNSHWDVSVVRNYSRFAKTWLFFHEFGHSLGLEHPFDDYDGDYYVTTNPWGNGATMNDTVMAYKRVNSYPLTWTTADRDALTGVWNDRNLQTNIRQTVRPTQLQVGL